MRFPRVKRREADLYIVVGVLILLAIGQVMVFSASGVRAEDVYGHPYFYLQRQALWALVGLGAMLVCSRINYRAWYRLSGLVFVVTLLLLLVVLVPGVGHMGGGSQRWLGFGAWRLQPSELAKLAVVIIFARYLAGCILSGRTPGRVIAPLLVGCGLVCGLILIQPDLGTAMAVAGTSFVLLFASGVSILSLAGVAMLALPAIGYLVLFEDYRRRRFLAFLDPWADPLGSGFHIIQSLYGLGSGFIFGRGLGQSRQKFYYIPELHTDFIFAVLGEELGFVGGTVVLGLFMFLIWRGYLVALRAPDPFGALLAAGVTTMIAVQVIMNVGVVTSMLPVTGITLPFFSYGGSSLVFTLAGVGILLNVSKYRRA